MIQNDFVTSNYLWSLALVKNMLHIKGLLLHSCSSLGLIQQNYWLKMTKLNDCPCLYTQTSKKCILLQQSLILNVNYWFCFVSKEMHQWGNTTATVLCQSKLSDLFESVSGRIFRCSKAICFLKLSSFRAKYNSALKHNVNRLLFVLLLQ